MSMGLAGFGRKCADIFEVPAPESAAGDPEPGGSPDKTPDRPETLAPQKIVVSPDPLNDFRWYTATDFGPAYQLGTVNTRIGTLSVAETLNKPTPNLFLKNAEQKPPRKGVSGLVQHALAVR